MWRRGLKTGNFLPPVEPALDLLQPQPDRERRLGVFGQLFFLDSRARLTTSSRVGPETVRSPRLAVNHSDQPACSISFSKSSRDETLSR